MRRLSTALILTALFVASGAGVLGAQDASAEEFARRQYDSGLAFLRDQKYTEALKDFQAVVDGYPNSRVADAALLQIAVYHLDTAGDPPAAQAAIDTLLKKYPTAESTPMAHVLAGRVLVARGRGAAEIDAALASYERVPRLFPGSDAVPAAMYHAGETLRLMRRDEEATTRYRQVSTDFPQSPWAGKALIGEARCLVATGKPQRAMELLQRVRQRFPNTADASRAMALNTILYRIYLRAPAQPAFQLATRAIAGSAGKLKDIEAVALDARDNVLAAGRSAVLVFDASGKVVSSITAIEPRSVSLDGGGRPLVAQKGGVVVGGQGIPLAAPKPDGTPRPLEEVPAVLASPLGDLLVADRGAKNIARFSPTGKYVGPFAAVNARRLAMDSTGLTAGIEEDGGSIAIIEFDGKLRSRLSPRGQGYQFDRPVDLAFDPFGHLYVLDRGQGAVVIFLLQPQPKVVATFGVAQNAPGSFRKATAFGLDSAGRLFIYDDGAERIQIYQ